MRTPAVLHSLGHVRETTIGGDLPSSHLHGAGPAFELLVESFNRIGGTQRGPVGRIKLQERQQGIQVFVDGLHRRRKQPTPLFFETEKSHSSGTLTGSIKDLIQIFGKLLSLFDAHPSTRIGFGMLLTTLGLSPRKESLKESFQSG